MKHTEKQFSGESIYHSKAISSLRIMHKVINYLESKGNMPQIKKRKIVYSHFIGFQTSGS